MTNNMLHAVLQQTKNNNPVENDAMTDLDDDDTMTMSWECGIYSQSLTNNMLHAVLQQNQPASPTASQRHQHQYSSPSFAYSTNKGNDGLANGSSSSTTTISLREEEESHCESTMP
eukprot:CAMPEP_0183786176 /NCGR_PEP_ID=MMETSP0739-20130205/66888_1 /TAXON_ID=385413 /ORGANISM="Thalassiosira miniscula, Strain CCMP1093" /LENGTH=115 /DNA_ID=CAMNT_0026030211 /DNA_START=583 /DNA_END=930 /DNA_ORIENTATION=-